jgi:hypothetical protein
VVSEWASMAACGGKATPVVSEWASMAACGGKASRGG